MANRSDRRGDKPITSVALVAQQPIGSPRAASILARSSNAPLRGRRYDCSPTPPPPRSSRRSAPPPPPPTPRPQSRPGHRRLALLRGLTRFLITTGPGRAVAAGAKRPPRLKEEKTLK